MRDPYLVAFIVALPLIQLLVTGLAIQRDINHIPLLVCDYDARNASIELLKDFQNSTYFNISSRNYVHSEDEIIRSIRAGRAQAGLIIPPDYSEHLLAGDNQATVNLVVDGTNANVAKVILNAGNLIVAHHAAMLSTSLQPAGASGDALQAPIALRTKVLYNPDLKSSYFLIPGILAIIMHMMTILFTSFGIVRERENGTLEQLMVTPIRVIDLMIGKVIPYALIGFLDMLLTLGVMIAFFDIHITGNFWFLCMASIIFILTSLAIGLLISTTCRSQVQAIQLTVGLLIPSLLISGFVFPIAPMPVLIKFISYSLPLTYYLEIIRGVIIRGIGFAELWRQTLVLLGISLGFLWVSVLRFKKQVA